ncbi:ACT domain-containing protein [Thalassotalea psychrophila]|uniref:Glycine cleavage system transcriptional repressor n=1 Tax=Thalassotalea psychrophila TaxID=3065647 RepID=A0ABY9TXC1_9GAMM|nr:ACT domain-containing protein [Colwelliaceae bacterium SQ149]
MRHVVISFLGKDRPGIVDNIASIVKQYNGNWQTSSLRHLSGFFCGIIEVLVSEENAENLACDVQKVEGLKVNVEVTQPSQYNENTISLELTANDRQGIVGEISAVIHKQHGNLVKLVSSQGSAPDFGHPIFKASAIIAINGEDKVDNLVDALESISDDLMVDINV